MKIKKKLGLTYDDVLLVPQFSFIESRKNVSTFTKFCGFRLDIPIISSPMDTVTGFDMANKLGELGAVGALHRINTIEEQCSWIEALPDPYIKVAAVGCKDEDKERVDKLIVYGVDVLIIDIAHGDSLNCINMLKYIKTNYPYHKVIAGSIATYDGTMHMIDNGADGIRCGIGNSGICTTRLVSGFGVPSLTSLLDCDKAIQKSGADITLIADGGIRSSGDIVKALASGAHVVMLGGLLAGTEETPGKVTYDFSSVPWLRSTTREYTENEYDSIIATLPKIKIYRGMASAEVYEKRNGDSEGYTPEGISISVPYKGPVSDIIKDLIGGIRSGLSYCGANDIIELQLKAEFIQITNSGLVESGTYGGTII